MISLIFVHYGMTDARRSLAKQSIISLYDSVKHLPCEIIFVDNGGSLEDSKYYLELADKGIITHYIRNHSNVWFGRGRNQALSICEGEYIAVMDNDLIYTKGWLDKCLEALKLTKDERLMATPMPILRCHKKYTRPEKEGDNEVNVFAGSNCWVMTKEQFKGIGEFEDHHFAGTLWCRRYARKQYSVMVIPGELVLDEGDKHKETFGYVRHIRQKDNKDVIIKKTLVNGDDIVYFKGDLKRKYDI